MGGLPTLKALVERHPDDVVVFGVNTDSDAAEFRERAASAGIRWPNLLAGSRRAPVLRAWAVRAFPTTVVLDRDLRLVAKGLHGEQLEGLIETLVNGGDGRGH